MFLTATALEIWINNEIVVFQLLSGNTDSHTVKVSYLEHPVTARFLRLHVQAWFNHPSLKMDIIGCQSRCFIIKEGHDGCVLGILM